MQNPAPATADFDEIVCTSLTLPGLREDSLKITHGTVTEGRYLLTFSRRALLPGPKARLQRIADQLGVAGIERLLPHVSAANAAHFGFEPEAHKIYLEFPPPRRPEPDLVFLALKAGAHGSAINRYLDRMPLASAAKQALLETVIPGGDVLATAHACLAEAGALLEVTEDDAPRRSLDINVADTGWKLADLPGLEALLTAFDLPPEALDAHKATPLGHFAAGRGRDGQPFATLYFGGRPMA